MKNKRFWILSGMIILALAVGCGKDDEPIVDNRISENNVINLGAVSDNTPETGSNDWAGNISDNAVGDISGNIVGSASDNMTGDVSGNITGSMSDNTPEDAAGNIAEDVPGGLDDSIFVARTNDIYIANMSGKDIESLTFIFSTDVGARDILGEEELKDGNLFVYTAADINALQQATGLRLKITATADDETVMEFPEIRVINIAGNTIVLSRGQSTSENQAGYEAYIQ